MHLSEQNLSYLSTQKKHDAEYLKAWEEAPEEFKVAARKVGLMPDVSNPAGMTMEYDHDCSSNAVEVDMAEMLDTFVDQLVEKYGAENELLIRRLFDDLKKPMELEIARQRASLLGRIAGYLIKCPTRNVLAQIHQLAHAIPGFAKQNGFSSMRASAKECRVSVEWLRRGRDKWCELLEVPVPADGQKSPEAKQRYRENALKNHWRNQTFQA